MSWPNSPFCLIFWHKILLSLVDVKNSFKVMHFLFLIKHYADGGICMSLDKLENNEVWIKISCSTNRWGTKKQMTFMSLLALTMSYKARNLEVLFCQNHEAMILCLVILHSFFLLPVIFWWWFSDSPITKWLILTSTPSHCLDTSRKVSVSPWTGILQPLVEIHSVVW